MENVTLQFPRSTKQGASFWQSFRLRIAEKIGWLLNWAGLPGAIRDCEISDSTEGHHIRIKTSLLYTKLTINGRDFYFDRISGRYDGSGSGCN